MKMNKAGGSSLRIPEDKIPEGEYPAVPALLTIAGLVEYLSQLGVQVENNRAADGSMLVY
jgi:hypothetical protein